MPGLTLPHFVIDGVPPATAYAASVYGTMLFPGPEEGAFRLAAAQTTCIDWLSRLAGGSPADVIGVRRQDLFGALHYLDTHSHSERVAMVNRGINAGYVLKFVFLLDKDPHIDASVKKAVAVLVKLKPVSERHLMACWSHYRSVAHLWAAYDDLRDGLIAVGPDWAVRGWKSFMKEPRHLLGIAEAYAEWGTGHVSASGTRDSTLPIDSIWRPSEPAGVTPSKPFLDPRQLYQGLTPEVAAMLESYRRN